jgi:hypothetical protein
MKTQIQFVQVSKMPVKSSSPLSRVLQHPVFAWAGLRAPIAQHTLAEHEALMRHARAASTIVEIGVAEGASAAGLREAMRGDGTLFLIDPFHLSRIPVQRKPSGSNPLARMRFPIGNPQSIFY